MNKKRAERERTKYDIRLCRGVYGDISEIEPRWRHAVNEHIKELGRRGCAAAGYALSGDDPWPRLCSKHVGPYRVIVSFPEDGAVAVMKIAKHDDTTDPYVELAREIGLEVSTDERTKPPCCDGTPVVDATLADRLEEHFAQLTRSQARAASRRRSRPA